MRRHQLFSIFAAPEDIYYPKKENVISSIGWGATTTSGDSVFADGATYAVIRSICLPPTTVSTEPFPKLEIKDGNGDTFMEWTQTNLVSGNLLHGPDGVEVPGGFSVEVSGADGGYLMVVFDVS
tara:strand:- start:3325 stop:3696 length:372 start_codon:yes stop_codon:yes gene_type:complete